MALISPQFVTFCSARNERNSRSTNDLSDESSDEEEQMELAQRMEDEMQESSEYSDSDESEKSETRDSDTEAEDPYNGPAPSVRILSAESGSSGKLAVLPQSFGELNIMTIFLIQNYYYNMSGKLKQFMDLGRRTGFFNIKA